MQDVKNWGVNVLLRSRMPRFLDVCAKQHGAWLCSSPDRLSEAEAEPVSGNLVTAGTTLFPAPESRFFLYGDMIAVTRDPERRLGPFGIQYATRHPVSAS